MRTLRIVSRGIADVFKELQNELDGRLESHYDEYILHLVSDLGCGFIRGISCRGGLSYLEFNIQFEDDLKCTIGPAEESPIYFTYCSRGRLGHRFASEETFRRLENFQTCILASKASEQHVLYFTRGVHNLTSILIIKTECDRGLAMRENLNSKLKEAFFKGEEQQVFSYIGSFNLKIADKIRQLNEVSQDGLVRQLLVEALVYQILALELDQHAADMAGTACQLGSLREREMQAIMELSEKIRTNPERPYLINELCRQVGLSPAKLQEGFKLMHDRTVSDFIREVRIQKAVDLIKNSDLNISEIVYSIGLTSRSYFSKIFKEKYHCSPKQFKYHHNKVAVTA